MGRFSCNKSIDLPDWTGIQPEDTFFEIVAAYKCFMIFNKTNQLYRTGAFYLDFGETYFKGNLLYKTF
jgi:hypothetical protein